VFRLPTLTFLAQAGKNAQRNFRAEPLHLVRAEITQRLTYLDNKSWSQTRLLRGENGLAAFTFCEVPVLPEPPSK
jgi:hypothetical protein